MKTDAKKTILLADDDHDFLVQMEMQLTNDGFDVIAAGGCREAEAVIGARRIDLAVIDLMMEEADSGFTLCHRIKQHDASIPIVLVTAVTSETGLEFDAATAEERSWIRADVLLDKPVRFEQLKREIDRLLEGD